ncbi:hypothetical protein GWI33_013593 [Rhynchophorus ferrugineus]|uniref:Ataxin-10 n=1 Tax=Rhynchophorus ferrugineus TaxID=354439 RepID=A0A834I7U1_RHYFE|nr:hypothetical protein GWI33_013593 [Rhynchophorus ferrugineus]
MDSSEPSHSNLSSICNISQLISENNWNEIKNQLEIFYRTYIVERESFSVLKEDVNVLLFATDIINSKFCWYNSLETPLADILTDIMKILRIYVTKEYVVMYLIENDNFYRIFDNLIKCIFTKKNMQALYTKYLLQCLVNMLTFGESNNEIRLKLASAFYEHIRYAFIENYGCLYEVSAVLYNILLKDDIQDISLLNAIIVNIGSSRSTVNEYLDFLFEKIYKLPLLWEVYDQLPMKSKLLVLGYLSGLIVASETNVRHELPYSLIKRLLDIFNKSGDVIFKLTQTSCAESSQELSYALQILSVLSGDHHYLDSLQSNVDLLINACAILINMNRLGKTSEHIFKPIQKLKDIQNPSEDIINNPVFGFKGFLIRLIGNLSWKSKRIQDLAREAEVIPVILDCCNIDAKNPFIMQWVILAIHNLCEDNLQNQAIISGLTQQGVVYSEVLNEFGISSYTEELLSSKINNFNFQ